MIFGPFYSSRLKFAVSNATSVAKQPHYPKFKNSCPGTLFEYRIESGVLAFFRIGTREDLPGSSQPRRRYGSFGFGTMSQTLVSREINLDLTVNMHFFCCNDDLGRDNIEKRVQLKQHVFSWHPASGC